MDPAYLMESSVAELNMEKNPSLLDRMKQEVERVVSFDQWPHDFMSPSDLARAGFFYLHLSDQVQCAFCSGVIMNWKKGDFPYIRHVNTFPLCPFLMGMNVGNVALGGDICGSRRPPRQDMPFSDSEKGSTYLSRLGVIRHQKPRHPSLASREARLKTFLSWPPYAAVAPEDLVEAGFFYVGIQDQVICFDCNGTLSEWEKGDLPWEEHARWLPHCPFLALHKGHPFIQSILQKYEALDTLTKMNIRSHTPVDPLPRNPLAKTNPSLMPHDPSEENSTSHLATLHQTVEWSMTSPMMRAFLEGKTYPIYVVRLALLHHLQRTGQVVKNIDEVCDAIAHVTSQQHDSLKEPHDQICPEENRCRQDSLACKICMTQDVEVVFLPCGHLLSCVHCSLFLTTCAICRTPIQGTVRTFFS